MGLERAIGAMADRRESWSARGLVTEVEQDASYGYLLTVSEQPSGRVIQARLLFPGARGGLGIFWPVFVGDEVLLLFPDGDPHLAIATPSPASSNASPPADWNNDTIRIEGAGDLKIELVSDNVLLGSINATDYVALALKVLTELQSLYTQLLAHTHTTGIGPTSPAVGVTTAPQSVAATKVKAE